MIEGLFETGFSSATDCFRFVGRGGAATGVRMRERSSPADVMIGTRDDFEEEEREGS